MANPSGTIASLCFCTAAFGEKYNLLAKLLAQDLEQFAPGSPFLVYTDTPQVFREHTNVQSVKHRCRGVLPYNERRFAIWDALSIAPSAMYLDADLRICAPVPNPLNFLPGLTARSCGGLQKHLKKQLNPQNPKSQHKQYVIEKMANRVGIHLDSPELKFINEFLFVITKFEGRELEFLQLWGDLAIYADTLGMHKHPTYAMALAAAKSNFPIHQSEMPGLDFFDDRIETVRINKGQSNPQAKAIYFQQQQRIEKGDRTLIQKSLNLAVAKSTALYNRFRVQAIASVSPSALINYPVVLKK